MFFGAHTHTIDSKGRLSIPAEFRAEIQERKQQAPVLTHDLKCLALYPRTHWVSIWQELDQASSQDPAALKLQRYLAGGLAKAPMDAQGRIVVPQRLREFARLEREVAIVGVGRRIEIWNRELFEQEQTEIRADLPELRSVFARLGTRGSRVGGSGGD